MLRHRPAVRIGGDGVAVVDVRRGDRDAPTAAAARTRCLIRRLFTLHHLDFLFVLRCSATATATAVAFVSELACPLEKGLVLAAA